MNITVEFLAKIDEIRNRQIPEEVLSRARQSLLDYLAVTSAGAAFQKDNIRNYIDFARPEEGDFNVFGCGCRLALKEAVFLNGLNGHALDFDDGTNSGIIHLGSPIFSLLLPLSQRYGNSLEEVLKAAVIGYEVSYTMAVSIQPRHKELGYHATGTCGVLGAATAAAYMLGFSDEERFHAFAAACVSATGMLSVLDSGAELKPYNVAKTVLMALTSVQIAKAGFHGNPDPLGNPRGYLKMMTYNDDVEIKPFLLNNTYAIMKSYTKPYASCRYTHPSVEAAIHLRKRVKAEEVERIDIRTYSLAVSGHDHTDIQGSYSAKMSIPYAAAVGMIYGKAGLQEFGDDKAADKNILDLANKIYIVSDDELSLLFPERQAAVV
ncbi:MAG: MmgE/PrpD family protein, partial [Butyrivibrio sp.]|nr:MmgE/PrpD family protein [Butyrivibrio sp.]